MNFDKSSFKTEPNFKFKEIVREKVSIDQFECYKDKNGEVYLIYAFCDIENNANKNYLSVLRLKDNIEVKSLEGHKDKILTIRYFQDPYTKIDYLVSSDRNNTIILWDLSNNFSKKLETKVDVEPFISILLLIFTSEKIYIVFSNVNDGTKFFDIDNKNIIFNITNPNFSTYFLEYWYNLKKNKHNIIICGINKVLIKELPDNEIYDEFKSGEKYPYNLGAIIFKNKGRDLLAVCSSYGLIQIYSFEYKEVFIKIILDNVNLYSFVKWNHNYLLINDCQNNCILVLDKNDNFQIKKTIPCPEMYIDRFIKKIEHPLYGESILSVGIDWTIKLFINGNQ